MSTRSMFSFLDPSDGPIPTIFNVYMHMDGYPSGAILALQAALPHAWPLPRFEADEFGAAFVAGNKSGGGNVRLMPSGDWKAIAPGDIEYRYDVTNVAGKLMVRGFGVSSGPWDAADMTWTETELFYTPLAKLVKMSQPALKLWQDRLYAKAERAAKASTTAIAA